ncbi:MAG TPA: sugar phosphate isomerase/epimerase family protein [Thermoguttaceae bacterium]|nr:sugar phosphate isomerase/epimerase family protein [Thermoguttaceae bacterium]
MNRRDMLRFAAGGFSAATLASAGRLLGSTSAERTPLGVCVYCLGIRSRAERARGTPADFTDPLSFLEYCRQLGAGGIQLPLGTKDEAYTVKLRRRAEDLGMFIEGIAGLPRDRADVERFEAEVRTAKGAGANVIRVVIIPGRRYERFDSADEFRKLAERGLRSLELAEPVAARHGVRLAVENHKDERVPERLALFERISSEHVGACVDVGNSFTLLEDPMEVVEAYAPWAFSVHLKDQAVGEYDDGFLFADVPLGEGFLDLAKMVETLRAASPQVRFSLEMITRDPLEVPCLTEKYWATLADVRGRDLARTLRVVRAHACERLPQISGLPLDEQARREEENVKKCLAYAGHSLGL